MDIEIATTSDILLELHRRGAHFVFAGFQPTNSSSGEGYVACQACSRREVRRLIRELQQSLPARDGPGLPD